MNYTQIKSVYESRTYSVEDEPNATPKLKKFIQSKVEETFPLSEINMWHSVLFLLQPNKECPNSVVVYSSLRPHGYGSLYGRLGKKLFEYSLKDENYLRPL